MVARHRRLRRTRVERANEIARALGQFGLPTVRHIANPATHAAATCCSSCSSSKRRLRASLFVAVGENDVLARDARRAHRRRRCSTAATIAATAGAAVREDRSALEDTVLFGRMLLVQANARSSRAARRRVACSSRPHGRAQGRWLLALAVRRRAARRRTVAKTSCARIATRLGREPYGRRSARVRRAVERALLVQDRAGVTLSACRPKRPNVVLGPGEDAGIVHSATHEGERYGIVVAHESHNHPSQVVPFEGAATGIGGIVRDVLCMGARGDRASPIRCASGALDDPHRTRYVAQSVVDGIGAYGNAIGVPNIAGDVYFDEGFDDNCLVNVVALGLVKEARDHPFARARRAPTGWDIVLVGKATDPQRFRRRVVLVARRSTRAMPKRNKGAVQVPDPFLKNVIMRATLSRLRGAARARASTVGLQGSRRGRHHGLLGGDRRERRLRRDDRSRRGPTSQSTNCRRQ